MDVIIGSHVSFKKEEQLVGSVKEALTYGANTLMIYTGAPQNTARQPLDKSLTQEAHKLMEENDIKDVIVHAPYIINLANEKNLDFGVRFLKEEIKRVSELGLTYLVLHPGSHVGIGEEKALNNISDALNLALSEDQTVVVLLETMAGKGSEVGKTIDELKIIIDNIKCKDKIGICLDTCHLNDAGYDISDFDNILNEIDAKIGLDKVKCVHINDSKNAKGSHKDRHENFGLGTIGFENLIKVIYHEKLKDVPKILETPYVSVDDNSTKREYPPYKHEITMIKSKLMNDNLIADIRNDYK